MASKLGDRPVVAASAVVGRLRDDGIAGRVEALGRIEAGRGTRTVQDNNVVNTTAAELVDEQWEGRAPEAARDADHRTALDEREAVPERSETVERVAGLQLGEQARPRTHGLEDEAAGVVMGPRNAERPAQQRRRSAAAAELRERAGHRGCGEVRAGARPVPGDRRRARSTTSTSPFSSAALLRSAVT